VVNKPLYYIKLKEKVIMEKFPKGEMGWVSEADVKEYIIRNYIPRVMYENLQAECARLLKKQTETQNALDYFVDDLMNYSGERELMRSAIKGGFSKEFIWREIYADNDLYEEVKAELIEAGEILADGEEADED
jgi:hypothetical protein